MPQHNCEGSIGGNNLNKNMKGNSLWWFLCVVFFIIFCVYCSHCSSDTWAGYGVNGMHIATDRSFLLEVVPKNIIKLSMKSYQSSPSMTWGFYFLKVKNLSLFNVPFNLSIWRLSQRFFQQLNCFVIHWQQVGSECLFPRHPNNLLHDLKIQSKYTE